MNLFLSIIGNDSNTPYIPSDAELPNEYVEPIWPLIVDWLFILLLGFIFFEIGNVIWRKWKRKPLKKHVWILLIAFILFVLARIILATPPHIDF